MYTKQETTQLRQEFWTVFGQYMAPLPSADGLKINWINYKTSIRHISFRMDADSNFAYIAIVFTHPDSAIRELYFEQMQQLEALLRNELNEDWNWESDAKDEHGKAYSRIFIKIDELNIFRRSDWPGLISFFKPRIMALDRFWSNARYAFESLE